MRKRRTILALVAAAAAIALAAGCSSKSPSASDASSQSVGQTGPTSATTCSTKSETSSDAVVAEAQAALKKAATPSTSWDGPTSGAKAQKVGGTVVFVPQQSSNSGDLGVVNGFKEAAAALGWKVKVIDGGGSQANELAAFEQALALHPIGIAVSSFDPKASEPEFKKAADAGIPVVGNHTGFNAGTQADAPDLFTNVTSDPATIAKIAADCAIVASNGTAGVTISSCGTEVTICVTKEDTMEQEIKKCSGCSVLAKNYYPFEDASQREGTIATANYQKFGSKLTYMLSVNDIYWDSAIPALKSLGVGPGGPPLMIAAGDGSPTAFKRIRDGQYQIATVAEPLNMHGWQLADELNRALAGDQPSGYVTYPHITTIENVNDEGGKDNTYEPSNGYKDAYKTIWGVS
jgi:ribose transport system substrate-binding protein